MPIRHFAAAACFALALLIANPGQSSAMPPAGPGLGASEIAGTAGHTVQPVDFYFYFGHGYHRPSFGFGYYPHYYYVPQYRPRYRARRTYRRGGCGYWSDRCIENWGYGNSNYRGCLRYHGCY